MATPPVASGDTPITLKINHDGTHKRLKLPLRDLGASVLESNIRGLLFIEEGTEVIIERYSDSGGLYMKLNESSVAAHKQLFRAAKAKSKLKFRVTTKPAQLSEPKTVFKPATVEDEVEEAPVTQPESSVHFPCEARIETQPEAPAQTLTELKASGSLETLIDDALPPVANAAVQEQLTVAKSPQSHSPPDLLSLPLHQSLNVMAREQMQCNLDTVAASVAAMTLQADNVKQEHLAENDAIGAKKTWPGPALRAMADGDQVSVQPFNFTVCCNSCDKSIPGAHYHCSTCDDGDFDLCQDCIERGITCHGRNHWLVKRFVENGRFVNSVTERIPPVAREVRPKGQSAVSQNETATRSQRPLADTSPAMAEQRLCNCCVHEFADDQFVHCTVCDDYDLCQGCFASDRHGHDPSHAFLPAVESATLSSEVLHRLPEGRATMHKAVCDACNTPIQGVRNKCLDCPDWDYCRDCVQNAGLTHPDHRFVSIYTPFETAQVMCQRHLGRPYHMGICCDGPLCQTSASVPGYIRGVRYKCAICPDVDFCAKCESSPDNKHNKTHPLIKFRTPVRHVTVNTTTDAVKRQVSTITGDQPCGSSACLAATNLQAAAGMKRTSEARTDTDPAVAIKAAETMAMKAAEIMVKEVDAKIESVLDAFAEKAASRRVRNEETLACIEHEKAQVSEKAAGLSKTVQNARLGNIQTAAPQHESPVEATKKAFETTAEPATNQLDAKFERDAIPDGTVMKPGLVFHQSWMLRNCGNTPWPTGCFVKCVGGDYMGFVDPNYPAAVSDLASSSESTVNTAEVAPGFAFAFHVPLRAPSRPGRFVSNWRLTTPDGDKFGHRLWCDVIVEPPVGVPQRAPEHPRLPLQVEPAVYGKPPPQMIFPKLEKESPASSVHAGARSEAPATMLFDEMEFEECDTEEDWAEDETEEGFLTDEEYDVLDASDEEFEDQQKTRKY